MSTLLLIFLMLVGIWLWFCIVRFVICLISPGYRAHLRMAKLYARERMIQEELKRIEDK